MEIIENFFKPSFIIFEKHLLTESDNRRLLVLAFIHINATRSGKVITSIDYLIKSLGYKPDYHKGAVNDKFVSQLKYLLQQGYISCQYDLEKLKPKDIFELFIAENKKSQTQENFVLLCENEFNTIVKANSSVDAGTLLSVFLNIKKRINFAEGFENVAYPSFATLKNECGTTSPTTIKKAINELCNLGVLFQHVTGSYVDKKGHIKNANNIYGLTPSALKNADNVMKDYLLNNMGIKVDSFS